MAKEREPINFPTVAGPLYELAVANENSPEYDLIVLYHTWFANQ